MIRRTLFVLTALALPAGCRDGAPPSESATTAAPDPGAQSNPRTGMPKHHVRAPRVAGPGVHRINIEPLGTGGAPDAGPAPAAQVFSFDKDKPDEAPAGFDFAASAGKPGKWQVKAEPG